MGYAPSFSSWSWVETHTDQQVLDKLQAEPSFLIKLEEGTPTAKQAGRLILILTKMPASSDTVIQEQFNGQIKLLFNFLAGQNLVPKARNVDRAEEGKLKAIFRRMLPASELERGLKQAIQHNQPQLAYEILNCLERMDANLKGPHNEPLLEWALMQGVPELAALMLKKGHLPKKEVFDTLHLAVHADKTEFFGNDLFVTQLLESYNDPRQLILLALTMKEEGMQQRLLGKIDNWQEHLNDCNFFQKILKQGPGVAVKIIQGLKTIPEPNRANFITENLKGLTCLAALHVSALQALKELAPPDEFKEVIKNPETGVLFFARDTETLDCIASTISKSEFFKLLSSPLPSILRQNFESIHFHKENLFDQGSKVSLKAGLALFVSAMAGASYNSISDPKNEKWPVIMTTLAGLAGAATILSALSAMLISGILQSTEASKYKSKVALIHASALQVLLLSLRLDPKHSKLQSFVEYFLTHFSASELAKLMETLPFNPFLGSLDKEYPEFKFSEEDLIKNIKLLKKYYTNEEVADILSKNYSQYFKNTILDRKIILNIARELGAQFVESWFTKIFDQNFREIRNSINLKQTKILFNLMIKYLGMEKVLKFLEPYLRASPFEGYNLYLIDNFIFNLPAITLKELFKAESNTLLNGYLINQLIKEESTSFFDFLKNLPYEERVEFILEHNIFHLIAEQKSPAFAEALSASPSKLYSYFAELLKHPDKAVQKNSWRAVLSKEVKGKNVCALAPPSVLNFFAKKLSVIEICKLLEKGPYKYRIELLFLMSKNETIFNKNSGLDMPVFLRQKDKNGTIFHQLVESPNKGEYIFKTISKNLSTSEVRELLTKKNSDSLTAIDSMLSTHNRKILRNIKKHYPDVIKEYISVDNPQILPLLKNETDYQLVKSFDSRFAYLELFYENGMLRKTFKVKSEKIESWLVPSSEFDQLANIVKSEEIEKWLVPSFPKFAQWAKKQSFDDESTSLNYLAKAKIDPSEFVKEVGDEALAAAFMLGDQDFLFTITQQLGKQKTAEQLQTLCDQLPVIAANFKEAIESISYRLDERHMDAEKVKLISGVEKEKLEPFDYRQILERFLSINFTDSAQPGYRDPQKLKNDVGVNSYELVSVATLKIGLDKLINRYIPENTPYVGTPPAFIGDPPEPNPELVKFYDNLKKHYQEILYYIAELEKQPPEDARELRDQLDKISRNFIDLAISSLHCGSRWVSEALESISDLKGVPVSLELMLNWLFAGMRTMVAEQIAGYYGADSHTTNTVMGFLGARMGLPKAEDIIEHLKDTDLNEDEVINRFYHLYTPANILAYLVEHLGDKPRLRNAVLDWFRDNPGEFKKEHYEAIKDDLRHPKLTNPLKPESSGSLQTKDDLGQDPELTELLKPESSGSLQTGELNVFLEKIKEYQFSKHLAERLKELESIKAKTPDEYPLELESIVRQEFRNILILINGILTPINLKPILHHLSQEPALQAAFEDFFKSSLSESLENYNRALDVLETTIRKIDQANRLVTYLKGKGVALDNETAMRAIGHKSPLTLIEGMIDRLRGNEFASTVYTSIGTQLLEAIPDYVEESEGLSQILEEAVTEEQKLDLVAKVWKHIFNQQYAEELKSMLKVARQEPALIESILQALRLPTQENIEACKTVLLREPLFQYRFDKEQLMRLLVEHQFLQRRAA